MKRQAHCERCAHTFSGAALALEALALVALASALFFAAGVLR